MPDQVIVRETRTPEEDETLYRATARVFGDAPDDAALAAAAARWRETIEDAAACFPVYRRAAFQGDTFLGSYTIYERPLRLGAHGEASLRTACIGVVLADPDRRMQGIGRALMQDAVRFAREREFALLLLGGIPNFYHRFGYVDVMERTGLTIERARIDELPAGESVTVRPATEADAPALLALYDRHWGAHPGGFVRPLEYQRRLLRPSPPGREFVLALDGQERPCGYLKLRDQEAGADTWAAASALLRHHARVLAEVSNRAAPPGAPIATNTPERPPTLTWRVPPGSRTHYLLAEHLPLASEVRSRPRAGWLARPAHLPTLVRSLLPMLEARWRRVAMSWSGRLTLHLTADVTTDQPGGTYVLELAPGRLTLAEPGDGDSGGAVAPNNGHGAGRLCLPDGTVAVGQAQPAGAVARLLPGAFTQLLFGFRPVWWVAEQPGNDLPDPARLLLETLFPVEPAWIAPTDGF